MAASCRENDYVHRLMARIRTLDPDAAFMVAQLAAWEASYWAPEAALAACAPAFSYRPDAIVFRLSENAPKDALDRYDFCEATVRLLEKFNPDGAVPVFMTTSFWPETRRDTALKRAAAQLGCPLIEIGDLGSNDAYTAKGLFSHSGVASHPGDAGMDEIASRLFEAMNPIFPQSRKDIKK